jgi:hypothetical protein
LHGYLSQQTNIEIKTTHFVKKNNNGLTITTLRNPYEAITSHVAMSINSNKNKENVDEEIIKKSLEYAALKYLSFHKDIEEVSNKFISYEELIKNPEHVLKDLYTSLNIVPISNNMSLPVWKDGHTEGYVVSSKNLNFYDNIKKYIYKTKNIDSCVSIYEKLKKEKL